MLRSRQVSALVAAVLLVAVAPSVSHAAMFVSRSARFGLWDYVDRAIRILGLG